MTSTKLLKRRVKGIKTEWKNDLFWGLGRLERSKNPLSASRRLTWDFDLGDAGSFECPYIAQWQIQDTSCTGGANPFFFAIITGKNPRKFWSIKPWATEPLESANIVFCVTMVTRCFTYSCCRCCWCCSLWWSWCTTLGTRMSTCPRLSTLNLPSTSLHS